MRVTVWVPGAEVISAVDKLIASEVETQAEYQAEIDKLKKSVLHDPNSDAKVAMYESVIKQTGDSIQALEQQKHYLGIAAGMVQLEFEQ